MSEWTAQPERRRDQPPGDPVTRPMPAAASTASTAPPRSATATVPRATAARASEAPIARGPRRARLAVQRLDPWSVLKFTFIWSLALLVIFVVAVALLYLVLDTMGVFDSIDATVRDITSSTSSTGITSVLSFRRIVGGAAVLGAINVVLLTALATLGAFLYNLCSEIVGGIEVTLSERD